MKSRNIRMAALAVVWICLLGGLSGCQKKPEHTLSQLMSVSISCAGMDRSADYTFWARKVSGVWLLDGSYCPAVENEDTLFSEFPLSVEDEEALLAVLEQCGSIPYAENYRLPRKSSVVADGTVYSFCLTFSDGTLYVTDDRQSQLESFFFRVAEEIESKNH